MSALTDALRDLAEARKQHEIAKGYAEEHQARVEAMTTYKEMIEAKKRVSVLGNVIGESESKVRELALEEHALTGEYKPADGVQIKEFNKVVYDSQEVWGWCIVHATKYLALNTKDFEKAAPVLRDLGAPVELTKEARAQIATNLDVWLAIE